MSTKLCERQEANTDFWIEVALEPKVADHNRRLIKVDRITFIEPLGDRWTPPVSKKEKKSETVPRCRYVTCFSPTAHPLMYTSWAVVENTQHDQHLFHLSTKILHRLHNWRSVT